MLGHRQRKAIASRTMPRAEWSALVSALRRESRNQYTRKQCRAAELARELCALTGTDLGQFGTWIPYWDNVGPLSGFDSPAGYVSRAAIIRAAVPQCIGANRRA